ncbi:uncharacterized protein K452DRAFT_319931 [Aplosporella prunicola CBS 121167]|uniref:DNA2/NAM7 helicase helicase domain-containing protein n=1 Tax=Aplosporella prunicola CBS 121167 TaxID=1176127 RepID=A0A6A6B6R4_9PEZI|nr:uncharacterized protein K452DRAFT_319931 [Aplosporella prunicola CBS 121167]KAF2139809.1 hypothetical protein K452DRAFT_319931 [Aplosporella prunicola CBS 121167]
MDEVTRRQKALAAAAHRMRLVFRPTPTPKRGSGGKSRLLAAITVAAALAGLKVKVVAPSNAAVTNIQEDVGEFVELLRLKDCVRLARMYVVQIKLASLASRTIEDGPDALPADINEI